MAGDGDTAAGGVVVSIASDFEGGNVEYVSQQPHPHDPTILDVHVRIRPDAFTALEDLHHSQYFCFRSAVRSTGTASATATATASAAGRATTVRYVVVNAHEVSYPEAWPGTTVCYTRHLDDVDSWRRNTDTFYTEGRLHWEHCHALLPSSGGGDDDDDAAAAEEDVVYFSYFPTYSRERHERLLDAVRTRAATATATTTNPLAQSAQVLVLGQSLQGRNVSCVQVGTGPRVAWIIHRQHPGETMAEHFAEGLLQKLLGLPSSDLLLSGSSDQEADDDPVVRAVLSRYTLYVVPCMCPDGAVLGHLRTNAAGANLNREWAPSRNQSDGSPYDAPTLERSPEVHCVLQRMDETGCDCFVDVHGDEELPFNFTMGANLVPNWSPRLESLLGAFTASYARFNSDMQQKYGYPLPESTEEAQKYMNVATNQVTDRFDCLAVTIEMPFKDCRSNPDPPRGWTPARSRRLGASLVSVLDYVHPYLRGDRWTELPPEDAYVPTTDDYGQEHGDNVTDEQFQMLKKRFYSDVHEIHKHAVAGAISHHPSDD